METALYLIPVMLSDEPLDKVLPAYNLQIVKEIKYFIVENVRSARRFLKKCDRTIDIDSLTFYTLDEHTRPEEIGDYLNPLIEGNAMGVISEAGCPAIADPGADVVAMAQRRGLKVVPLVGPSSILLSLMASGFNGQSFAFQGYLPIDAAKRQKKLHEMERNVAAGQTQIFIETPYRNNRMLEAMTEIFAPDTRITAAVDVTGDEESIRTLTAREWKPLVGTLPKLPTVFAVLASPSAAPKAHKTSKAPHPAKSLLKGSAPAATHKKAPAARGTSHVPHPRRAPKKH